MLRVTVALAAREGQEVVSIRLPEGSTVADALAHPEVARRRQALALDEGPVGIWSKTCAADTPLRDGDRVEIYRPLQADPKEMRRARARLRPSTRSRSGP